MGRAPRASTDSPPSEGEKRSVHRGLTISSGTEVATEEERALLQHRLALFTRALFVLVVGTYPIGLVELRNSYGLSWSEIANHPVHMHLLFVAGVGLSWWFFAARPRRRSMLEMGDAALTIGFCVIWVVAVMAVIFQYPEKATSAQVDTGSVSIVIALLVVVRAALVPSRISRCMTRVSPFELAMRDARPHGRRVLRWKQVRRSSCRGPHRNACARSP